MIWIVPVGTMGKAISFAGTILDRFSKVVQQIETPRSPDPIMRRLRADREEKRVTRGATRSGKGQEKLDLTDPNQKTLLGRVDELTQV